MRAFLINPKDKSITEIETKGELGDLYKLIGCNLIDVVILNDEEDVLYLDDEGLYRTPNYFRFGINPNPLAGRAVVLGTNIDGEAISPKLLTLELLEVSVSFISGETAVTMAEEADAAAQKRIDSLNDGWEHIHLPIADIIRSAVYNGKSEGVK